MQLVQVEQVSDLFLNRPFVTLATSQDFRGNSPHFILDSRRCPSDPLDDIVKEIFREIEFKSPLNP
jgi:hypothetical protein